MTCKLELMKNFPIKNYADQVNFTSKEAQYNEMSKYVAKTFDKLSTVNMSAKNIRLDMTYYVGNEYNYGRLTYNNDVYYVFITSVIWQSNNNCILHFEYDYWQTYQFRIKKNKCMIEREHVSDDTFGKHIIDEGIASFGVKAKNIYDCLKDLETSLCVAVSDTSIIKSSETLTGSVDSYIKCGRGYSPCVAVFDSTNFKGVTKFLELYVENNLIDSIVSFYRAYVDENQTIPATIGDFEISILKSGYSTNANKVTVPRMSTISGYKPKNNKCFCYPYNYIKVSDCNGNNNVYQFELQQTATDSANFLCYFPPNSGGACYTLYDNYIDALSGVIAGQSNIELPWISNVYSAYLSANQNTLTAQKQTIDDNLEQSRFNNIVNTLSGVANSLIGGALGGKNPANLVNMGTGIANTLINSVQTDVNALYSNVNSLRSMNASLSDIQSKGDVLHGQFTSNLADTQNVFGFRFYTMQVSKECIEMVDAYFEMNGYKVNRVGTPQWTSRKNWNFIKTVNSNITGNIPTDALVVINNMFNNGVTMWHSLANVYNYDLDNSIV